MYKLSIFSLFIYPFLWVLTLDVIAESWLRLGNWVVVAGMPSPSFRSALGMDRAQAKGTSARPANGVIGDWLRLTFLNIHLYEFTVEESPYGQVRVG